MRTVPVVSCLLTLLASAAPATELQRLSLDDAASVSPKIECDANVKVEGAASLKIVAEWPTTVCLGEVSGLDIENAKLVYSAQVKTELEGSAFLELWAHVGGGQYFSRGMNDVAGQTNDWKTIQTPFMFQAGQKPEKVTLNLVIQGKGTVWIDDVVLSRQPLE